MWPVHPTCRTGGQHHTGGNGGGGGGVVTCGVPGSGGGHRTAQAASGVRYLVRVWRQLGLHPQVM